MPYTYNPHSHVKIFLSPDRNVFMNSKNQLRLLRMRQTNPNDEIFLVFDSQLLSPESITRLFNFCQALKIVPKDVRDLFMACKTAEEKQLVAIYNEHLKYLDQSSKFDQVDLVVRCKDIICWIEAVYTLGTYSDCDDHIDTSKIKTIQVNKPLLMTLGCQKATENNYFTLLNNNIIAVVDSVAALPLIKKIQRNIIAACSSFEKGKSYFVTEKGIPRFPGNVFGDEDVICLHELSQGQSILAARFKVLEFCSSNEQFLQAQHIQEQQIPAMKKLQLPATLLSLKAQVDEKLLDSMKELIKAQHLPEEQKEKVQRENIESTTSWINQQTIRINQLVSLFQNEDELIKTTRKNYKQFFIHQSVLCTTGPLVIDYSLFGAEVLTWKQMLEKVAPYSFAHYGLNSLFPKSEVLEFNKDLESAKNPPRVKSDMSWMPGRENELAEDNHAIENAVITLQTNLRRHNALEHLKFFKSSNQKDGAEPLLVETKCISSDLT